MSAARRLFARAERTAPPVRQLNPLRDLDRVAELVEIAFRDEPGRDIHQFRSELRSLRGVGPLIWGADRLSPFGGDLLTGYVYEHDRRIVGCLTLSRLPGSPTRWLIANVAVHPEYRRRGIARQLMDAALLHARQRGGGLVVLDVRRENEPAYSLYQRLGFMLREETVEWRWLPGVVWPQALPAALPVPFEPLRPAHGERARALLRDALSALAREATPISETDLRLYGLFGHLLRVADWFSGRDTHRLAATRHDRVDALILLRAGRWSGLHQLNIVLRPGLEPTLAPAALVQAVGVLRSYPPVPISATLRSPHPALLEALDSVGFKERQTLHRLALPV